MVDGIRYGIVGGKGIGEYHARAVEAADGATLVACADIDETVAGEFAETWGCAPYADAVEMIRDAALDAVSICTPSGTHATLAVDCLEAGAHVLCEKPLDVYAERIDEMVAAAERTGNTLAGVFNNRSLEAVQRAKAAVEAGELGTPVLGDARVRWYRSPTYYESADWRGTRAMDGGVLMNQAIHAIDLLQWLMGDVDWVDATCRTLERDIEVEDTAVMTIGFEGGAIGTIEATTVTEPDQPVGVDVTGTAGSFSLSDYGFDRFETTEGSPDTGYPTHEFGVGHERVVQDFVTALHEGIEPMVPAREARKAVDIVLAAYASSSTETQVRPADIRAGEYDRY